MRQSKTLQFFLIFFFKMEINITDNSFPIELLAKCFCTLMNDVMNCRWNKFKRSVITDVSNISVRSWLHFFRLTLYIKFPHFSHLFFSLHEFANQSSNWVPITAIFKWTHQNNKSLNYFEYGRKHCWKKNYNRNCKYFS